MAEENKNEPAKKLRNLLGGDKAAPMTHLPRKDGSAISSLPHSQAEKKLMPNRGGKVPPSSGMIQFSTRTTQPSRQLRLSFGPPFWTIASVISLLVNVVLVISLISLMGNLGKLNLGNTLNLGNDLLGGLFTNFEKMERANISTNVQVITTIPVKFDLQLNQQTTVVLSQDVTIDNAVVTVKTGGLNITNALTTIILPQGTTLPIVLNLTVPVDTSVPVTLNIPVDIPLEQTELHEPFVGLQDVIRPLYCMINRNASNLDGQPVCK